MLTSSECGVSRRGALWAVASGAFACQRGRGPMRAAPATGDAAGPWGGLQVASAGTLREHERGGVAVVLLHGWGAPADDLVPLGQALARPGTRFFMPGAPLPGPGGGRAWWHLDASDRPAHAWDDTLPAGHVPHRDVAAARRAVQTVLRTIRERYAPERLAVAGFSQGAMLALDVTLDPTPGAPVVDRVGALSGLMLADSVPGLRAPRTTRPPAFVSHGRFDQVLPFEAGERAKDLLTRHNFPVTWHPFDGGHDIPRTVVSALAQFLFA